MCSGQSATLRAMGCGPQEGADAWHAPCPGLRSVGGMWGGEFFAWRLCGVGDDDGRCEVRSGL